MEPPPTLPLVRAICRAGLRRGRPRDADAAAQVWALAPMAISRAARLASPNKKKEPPRKRLYTETPTPTM